MTGKLEIMDKIYNFGTGGHGRGSIPFGDYPVTPNEVGHWGERHDAIGINGLAPVSWRGEDLGLGYLI